tara:strand:- start:702 stop:977 length:276 start_codon:yes stop_codon:yes gene_type:complete
MSRYSNTKIKKNEDGVTHYQATIYKAIPESNEDVWVITQFGDRLDNLAAQFYGDSGLWWILAKANGLLFPKLPIGTSLRIPPLEKVGREAQ